MHFPQVVEIVNVSEGERITKPEGAESLNVQKIQPLKRGKSISGSFKRSSSHLHPHSNCRKTITIKGVHKDTATATGSVTN